MKKIIIDVQILWKCRECNKLYVQDDYPFLCSCGHTFFNKRLNWIYSDLFEHCLNQLLSSISKGVIKNGNVKTKAKQI